jgi:aspartate aminotransferase
MLATEKSFVTRALSRLGSENAFQILQRARELEASGRRVVHMEIGEPDFDTPENIKHAAVASLMAHDTHYTPSQGTLDLREVIADYATRLRRA